ncbi:hypothetical protein GE21DRAFT_1007691 [Neurospora crassa]|nr:hypothetical protein GE21DRAFT_1007691 [Neurospora crassa]
MSYDSVLAVAEGYTYCESPFRADFRGYQTSQTSHAGDPILFMTKQHCQRTVTSTDSHPSLRSERSLNVGAQQWVKQSINLCQSLHPCQRGRNDHECQMTRRSASLATLPLCFSPRVFTTVLEQGKHKSATRKCKFDCRYLSRYTVTTRMFAVVAADR